MNVVVVQGVLSRAPEERELANGSRVVAYEVTVDRAGQRAETVPVVWVDPPPAGLSFETGAEVVALGRVRRRFFRAGGSTQSRTEVVADTVLGAGQRRRVRAALGRAVHALEASAGPRS